MIRSSHIPTSVDLPSLFSSPARAASWLSFSISKVFIFFIFISMKNGVNVGFLDAHL